MEHRIFHHKGVIVFDSMRSEPKATSRLSWEPVGAGHGGIQENGEPRNSTARPRGGLSLSTLRRVPGWLWQEFERDPGYVVPRPIQHGARGRWTRARVWLVERVGALVERRCPWERRVGVCFKLQFCSAVLLG